MKMKSKVLMDVSDFQIARVDPLQSWHQHARAKGNESRPLLAPQMGAHQIPRTDSQTVYNGKDCLNEVEDPNAVNNFLDLLDFDAELAKWKTKFPDYVLDATWCNEETFSTIKTEGTDNQGIPSRRKRHRGPKPRIMYDGNGPMQLWQFILSLLVSSPSERVVEWTRERKYEFRILQPDELATLWGAQKKKPAMNFKKLARGLRYYYGKSILEKARGKQYAYEFVMDIAAILGYDPVGEIPEGMKRNTKFSKLGITPSTAFHSDELHLSGSVGQMKELRGTMEGCGGTGEGFWDTGEGFVDAFEGTGEEFWGTEKGFGGTEEGNGFGDKGEGYGGTKEGTGFGGTRQGFEGIKEGLDGIKQEFRCTRDGVMSVGEGLWNPGVGFSGIKAFDFSVLVESNETSSFYEAL